MAANAKSTLAAADATKWAGVEVDGRDVKITGESPTQAGIDDAVKAVAGSMGVRRVDVSGAKLAALAAPTIESITTANAQPEIKGTWPEGAATALAVTVAGTTYTLGQSPELTSSAGNWTLKPSQPIAEGSYDATVEASDGATRTAAAASPAKVVVDVTPPALPAPVIPTMKWPYSISGTWGEEPGAKLQAEANGKTYVLGTDPELTSDGAGTYTFTPTDITAPGSYDIKFTSNDAVGNVTTVMAPAAIVIPAPEPLPEPVVEGTPPAALPNPTVIGQLALTGAPLIKGTWPHDQAKMLKVTIGGKSYELGKDANLSAKDGNWTLLPSAALKDGYYDVVVDVANEAGATARDLSVAEVEVDGDPPAAPTVVAPTGDAPITALTGTWDEKQAKSLTVSVPDAKITATLGAEGSPLTSDGGGNWSLALATPLNPGTYEVQATTTDVHGRTQTDTSAAEVVVAAAPAPEPEPTPEPAPEKFVPPTPPTPQIGLYAGPCAADAPWPREIKGRWSEGTALNLKAKLGGRTYELGKGMALTSNGSGVFTFAPKAAGLKPGSNTIWFTSKGPGGDVRVAKCDITVPAPVVVAEAPAEPAPAEPAPVVAVPAKPFDCAMTLARINQVFPIRFEFDKDELQGISSLSLAQYAALLKDPRCGDLKVELGGHADFRGGVPYNQGLSERRAQRVFSALTEAGIDAARMTPKGFSELVPFDPATTDEARAKNRRVEVTVIKN